MAKTLRILSGGAAQGLVGRLQPAFEKEHGCRIEGSFGAVGAMKDKLLGGAPCDLLILTQALIDGRHLPSMAMALARRAYGMEEGRIVADGLASELVNRPEIRKAYLGLETHE